MAALRTSQEEATLAPFKHLKHKIQVSDV